MKKLRIILFSLITLLFIIIPVSGITQNIDIDNEIISLDVKEQSLFDVVKILRTEYGLQIGFEEREYSKADIETHPSRVDSRYMSTEVKKRRINVFVEKKSLRNILDYVVSIDSDYFWEINPEGVLNILPKSDNSKNKYGKSIINFVLPNIDINTTFQYAINQEISNMLIQNGMSRAELTFGDMSEFHNTHVKVKLEKPTLKQFLNTLIKSAGSNYGWNIMGLKGERLVTFSWHKIENK